MELTGMCRICQHQQWPVDGIVLWTWRRDVLSEITDLDSKRETVGKEINNRREVSLLN